MSETPEHRTEPTETTTSPVATATLPPPPPVHPPAHYQAAEPAPRDKPNRLYQVAAWIAIVAGTVFIVAAIFFSGFILGRHSGGEGPFGGHRHHGFQMEQRGGPPMGPMGPMGPMRPMGPGPGFFFPGGPGGQGPQGGPGGGSSQSPTTAPARP